MNNYGGNTASGYGGALVVGWISPLAVANIIVALNKSDIEQQAAPYGQTPVVLDVRNNDVFGNEESAWKGLAEPPPAAGNLYAEPLFADRASRNYHLTANSLAWRPAWTPLSRRTGWTATATRAVRGLP